ncbi:MAG TPA: type II toxin-antitoxin system RelE/ParE family toxin [Parafilimonas sp.]|nr:type II toxin-antitoxin system RelE/ParE family toxin [Parafilimonas sp.]
MPNAIHSYIKNVDYLKQNWTGKEVDKFIDLVEKKIHNLSNHPRLGVSRNKKYPNIRLTLIHKRVALIYRHKPAMNEIELLVFWNTSQNPRKLKSIT